MINDYYDKLRESLGPRKSDKVKPVHCTTRRCPSDSLKLNQEFGIEEISAFSLFFFTIVQNTSCSLPMPRCGSPKAVYRHDLTHES